MQSSTIELNSAPDAISPGFFYEADSLALGESYHPVTAILGFLDHHECAIAKDKLEFCYRAVLGALQSCLKGKYNDFDAHTTSNCCHGMALFACTIIRSALQLDLHLFQQEGEQKVQELAGIPCENAECTWWVPQSIIHLACLYILGLIKESDPVKGGRTVTKKLKTIAPISTTFCNQVAHYLQKHYSNLIATRYAAYTQEMDPDMQVSGAPLHMWGKYIQADRVRTDKRGVKYASNLFSMQVFFAHLIKSKAKVALINDILDLSGNLKDRYVCFFEGDGQESLRPIPHEEIKLLQFFHHDEPVVVLGGCAYAEDLDKEILSFQMEPWQDQLSNLLLACDVFYPQFFKVTDDPEFDNSPISPDEELLKNLIDHHQKTPGVSASDPSFYCAAHIYPASLKQVLQVWNEEDKMGLPISFIPGVKLKVN